jgi:hypothetical protein
MTLYQSFNGSVIVLTNSGRIVLESLYLQGDGALPQYSFINAQFGIVKLYNVSVDSINLGEESFITMKNNVSVSVVNSNIHSVVIYSEKSLFLEYDSNIMNEASFIEIINSSFENLLSANTIYGGIVKVNASSLASLHVESCSFYQVFISTLQSEGYFFFLFF